MLFEMFPLELEQFKQDVVVIGHSGGKDTTVGATNGRAEPPSGIHLKRKNGSALMDQGHTMNETGLVGIFAATTVRVSSETCDGDRGIIWKAAGNLLTFEEPHTDNQSRVLSRVGSMILASWVLFQHANGLERHTAPKHGMSERSLHVGRTSDNIMCPLVESTDTPTVGGSRK